MARHYYKESGTKYGRPAKNVDDDHPPDFSFYDTKDWNARRWFKEIADRQGRHEWARERGEWETPLPTHLLQAPIIDPNANLIPITDPDEINKFLCRPPAVRQVTSKEDAEHDLALGRTLISVDPYTPDLADKLTAEAKKIRRAHPLPIKNRGHQGANAAGITKNKVLQWRAHRLVELCDLKIMGYDPAEHRKQIAAWLFPEISNQEGRGKKLDRAVKLLNEMLKSMGMIDAQTR
jgi:hypothetical protein